MLLLKTIMQVWPPILLFLRPPELTLGEGGMGGRGGGGGQRYSELSSLWCASAQL